MMREHAKSPQLRGHESGDRPAWELRCVPHCLKWLAILILHRWRGMIDAV